MKKYVLTVSTNFPSYHIKKGKPTGFIEKIKSEIKVHTIRGNYTLWKHRIDEIIKGNAKLSIRTWSGRPYASPQKIEIEMTEGVGIEKIEFTSPKLFSINGTKVNFGIEDLAKNDGLTLLDFESWFKDTPTSPMAIIHFTDFRYN